MPIGLMTFNVFVTIFGSGEGENEDDGKEYEAGIDGAEEREELEDGDSCEESGGAR